MKASLILQKLSLMNTQPKKGKTDSCNLVSGHGCHGVCHLVQRGSVRPRWSVVHNVKNSCCGSVASSMPCGES